MNEQEEQVMVRKMLQLAAGANEQPSGRIETFFDEDPMDITINIDNDGIVLFDEMETVELGDDIKVDDVKYGEQSTDGQYKTLLNCSIASVQFTQKLEEFKRSFNGLFNVIIDRVVPLYDQTESVEITYHLVPKEQNVWTYHRVSLSI